MTKEDKLNLQLISAAVLVIVGCGLLIGGFCVAPLGIIDSSVLIPLVKLVPLLVPCLV